MDVPVRHLGLHVGVHFVGHSTVRVELAGRTVLTDPVLTARVGPLRRVAPLPDAAAWSGVDVVVISHLHGDHLHLPSLRMLQATSPEVRVVVPRGAGRWLRARGISRVSELAPGQSMDDGDLRITAVTAEHSGYRFGPRLTSGPRSPAVGHLLEDRRPGGRSVYASGDTDLFPGMAALADRRIDVALLPVWGWGPNLGPGHLDPARAAEAVARIRPRVAVPVHWGTLAVAGARQVPRLRVRMAELLVAPPRTFAEAVAVRGLETCVVVAEPGTPVSLPEPVSSG